MWDVHPWALVAARVPAIVTGPALLHGPAHLMSEFIEVLRAEDLPEGRIRSVAVGDRRIALYHTARGFFASDNVCPHRGGPLSEGDLIGDEIVCPWHLWGFDVASGLCAGNPDIRIVTHEVQVSDGNLCIRLSPQKTEVS